MDGDGEAESSTILESSIGGGHVTTMRTSNSGRSIRTSLVN